MHTPTFLSIAHFALYNSELTSQEKLVLLGLGPFINNRTKEAWPSHKTLSDLTGLSAKTIQRTIHSLEAKGILINRGQRKRSDGSRGSNEYVFTVDLGRHSWGGLSDHRSTSSTRYIDMGISMVNETTPDIREAIPQEPGASWIADISRTLSYSLADILIQRGLKGSRYRDDAASDEWIYGTEQFVGGTLDFLGRRVGEPDLDLFARIYEQAIVAAPDHLDFRKCDQGLVPPRLLCIHADDLVARAAATVLRDEGRDPLEDRAPSESSEAISGSDPRTLEFIEEVNQRMKQKEAERERARVVKPSRGRRLPRVSGHSPTAEEERADRAFEREIEEVLQAESGRE